MGSMHLFSVYYFYFKFTPAPSGTLGKDSAAIGCVIVELHLCTAVRTAQPLAFEGRHL